MFCECGCGEKTRLAPENDSSKKWVKGQPLRFLLGHQGVFSSGPPPSKGPWFHQGTNRWFITARRVGGGRAKLIPWSKVVYENAFRNGEELPAKAIVHHLNGDSTDDSLGNLMLAEDDADHKSRYHSRAVLLKRGEEEHRFESVIDAAEFLGITTQSVYAWLVGVKRSGFGWTATYVS